jgi:ribosomal-protein-alanine N-acetyltransferase
VVYETPELETKRLIIKRGNISDYKKVYEYDFTKLRNINGEFEYVKNDPKKIESWNVPSTNSYDWIIYLKDNNEPIGNITTDNDHDGKIELAFNTHPNYWRNGYTYEALIEVMRFLFNNGYDNILCGYDEGNYKSKAIGEKLGFVPYKKEENSWIKNGVPITSYTSILSKERFNELYSKEK